MICISHISELDQCGSGLGDMRWIVIIVLCGALAACVTSCIRTYRQLEMHVWTRPLYSEESPDKRWNATVDETVYEPGWGEYSQIILSLNLRSRHDPAESAKILSMEYYGHTSDRPRLSWSANDSLQVIVPNLSDVTVYKHEFSDIHVDLRFDPNDPATRAAWLKWRNAPRGHPTSVQIAEVHSPDGNWIAAVDEINNGRQFFPHDIVTLTSTRDSKDHEQMLYVGTTEEGRWPPRVSWVSADELQVTVPNRSYVSSRKQDRKSVV